MQLGACCRPQDRLYLGKAQSEHLFPWPLTELAARDKTTTLHEQTEQQWRSFGIIQCSLVAIDSADRKSTRSQKTAGIT
jgi:hypothetical protein